MYAAARLFNRRTIVGFALLLLVMAVAYGFAAANVVADSSAGDGTGKISGYEISDIQYMLAGDPRELAAVSFKLSDDGDATNGDATLPATLKIGFHDTSGAEPAVWFDCSIPSAMGDIATCKVSKTKVVDIGLLEVIAAN